jgi:glycosyltransferase involved in cell wall biosynthesis
MADAPRVTLGVTTCNVDRFLPGAFDAVLAQDFADFEVVVCDNQSTDSTWDICERYARKDNRFRVYRNDTNLGQAGNFRRVVELARGEYFRLTSHDDLMAPTLLRRCVEVLDADPSAVLARPRTIVISDAGDELFRCADETDLDSGSPSRRIAALLRQWSLCNEVFGLIRTDVLRRTRLLSPHFVSSDRRMLVELAVRGRFRVVDEPLFYRRVDQSSSYGGDRSGPTYQWLEPELAERGHFPEKYAKLGGDYNALTVETMKALVRNELPLPTRLTTTAAFGVFWTTRRARTTVGRWRRRVTGAR